MQECCRGISRFYDAEPARLVDFRLYVFFGVIGASRRGSVQALSNTSVVHLASLLPLWPIIVRGRTLGACRPSFYIDHVSDGHALRSSSLSQSISLRFRSPRITVMQGRMPHPRKQEARQESEE